MNIATDELKALEKAILSEYDNGRTMPLGGDGGCLKYVTANIYGKKYKVSITTDYDLQDIRRICELDVASDTNPYNYDYTNIYDLTDEYYKYRKAVEY